MRRIVLLSGLCLALLTAVHSQSTPQIIITKLSDAIEGSNNGRFRIALNDPIPMAEDITVSFSRSGTAIIATDYNLLGLSGANFVIPAGNTEIFIEVDAGNDGIVEGPETVGITLTGATSVSQTFVIDPTRMAGTLGIIDGNAASTIPLQVIHVADGVENGAAFNFQVGLAGGGTRAWPITVGFSLSGTASNRVDFQLQQMVVIPANTNSVMVPVTPLDEHIIEGTETINFRILSGSATDGGGNAFFFPPDPAFDNITMNLDDDDISDPNNRVLTVVKTADAAEPSTSGAFTVSLPGDYRPATRINLNLTRSGTAINGTDYTLNTVILPAYFTSISIPVQPMDDTDVEGNETATLSLSTSLDARNIAYTANPVSNVADINITDNEVSLPLQLVSFAGSLQTNGSILLGWKTAAEENTHFFEVLHSADGNRFVTAGKVPAAGSGNNYYAFTDKQPQQNNYYRLRMVDKDGQATYSNIIMVRKNQLTIPSTIYPNPTKGQVTLTIGNDKLIHTKAMLVDALGLLRQVIYITDQSQTISLNNYSKGVYVLKLENGERIRLVVE